MGATVRFWAGARRAAGHAEETTDAVTIGQLREQLAARNSLTEVIAVSAFLVDGVRTTEGTVIPAGSIVDVLPPFAGG